MFSFFFFNDTATTEIYTLSLHDALPISFWQRLHCVQHLIEAFAESLTAPVEVVEADRKSTRLNSSHSQISYAVFCLKKKNVAMSPEARSATATMLLDTICGTRDMDVTRR